MLKSFNSAVYDRQPMVEMKYIIPTGYNFDWPL